MTTTPDQAKLMKLLERDTMIITVRANLAMLVLEDQQQRLLDAIENGDHTPEVKAEMARALEVNNTVQDDVAMITALSRTWVSDKFVSDADEIAEYAKTAKAA